MPGLMACVVHLLSQPVEYVSMPAKPGVCFWCSPPPNPHHEKRHEKLVSPSLPDPSVLRGKENKVSKPRLY